MSAGLDYPGVGPEHALLMSVGRVKYEAVNDDDALDALAECCAAEGILPAIESSHALAGAKRYAQGESGQAHSDRSFRARRQRHADAAAHDAEGTDLMMAARDPDQRGDSQREGSKGGPALVAYITAGFPTREGFLDAAARGRCDAPTSSRSACRSPIRWRTARRFSARAAPRSSRACRCRWILAELAGAKPDAAAPLLLMSYLNPLLAFGLDKLPQARGTRRRRGLHRSRSAATRNATICARALDGARARAGAIRHASHADRACADAVRRESSGFVYAVTMTGTTGKNVAVPQDVLDYFARVKSVSPVPVCAGFGIRRVSRSSGWRRTSTASSSAPRSSKSSSAAKIPPHFFVPCGLCNYCRRRHRNKFALVSLEHVRSQREREETRNFMASRTSRWSLGSLFGRKKPPPPSLRPSRVDHTYHSVSIVAGADACPAARRLSHIGFYRAMRRRSRCRPAMHFNANVAFAITRIGAPAPVAAATSVSCLARTAVVSGVRAEVDAGTISTSATSRS